MPTKMTIFLLLLSFSVSGQERERTPLGYNPLTDVISEKYEAGPYLIYDCEEKHWVCVMESYYKDCEVTREEDVLAKKQNLRCAPLGMFPNKISCFQRQLFLVGQNFATRFCIHPEMNLKQLEVE